MHYLVFAASAAALAVLSVACIASFWFDVLASVNAHAALFVSLVLTTPVMVGLTIVAFLVSAGAFCPELLTTEKECDALQQHRWVMLGFLIWVPVMLYASVIRLGMARKNENAQ